MCTAELATAEEKEIPRLSRQIQRLRVSSLVLKEITTDLSDPTTYRELTLLNKLTTGHDPEEEAALEQGREDEKAATERLEQHGVSPVQAGRMVSALQALASVMRREKETTDAAERDRTRDPG